MAKKLFETDLYQPVKTFLEGQGYEVKSEVGAADVVAVRGEEPPVIVELKTGFSLALFHQAIERLKLTDSVYVAVPEWKGRAGWKAFVANQTLCRRLGLGLMAVKRDCSGVDIRLDPGPYAPRQSKQKRNRLLKEFHNRVGDPNTGGMTRTKQVTSYRQDALRCLELLDREGPMKAAKTAKDAKVKRARDIMADNHYGWFEKVDRGIYGITDKGQDAIVTYASELEHLT